MSWFGVEAANLNTDYLHYLKCKEAVFKMIASEINSSKCQKNQKLESDIVLKDPFNVSHTNLFLPNPFFFSSSDPAFYPFFSFPNQMLITSKYPSNDNMSLKSPQTKHEKNDFFKQELVEAPFKQTQILNPKILDKPLKVDENYIDKQLESSTTKQNMTSKTLNMKDLSNNDTATIINCTHNFMPTQNDALNLINKNPEKKWPKTDSNNNVVFNDNASLTSNRSMCFQREHMPAAPYTPHFFKSHIPENQAAIKSMPEKREVKKGIWKLTETIPQKHEEDMKDVRSVVNEDKHEKVEKTFASDSFEVKFNSAPNESSVKSFFLPIYPPFFFNYDWLNMLRQNNRNAQPLKSYEPMNEFKSTYYPKVWVAGSQSMPVYQPSDNTNMYKTSFQTPVSHFAPPKISSKSLQNPFSSHQIQPLQLNIPQNTQPTDPHVCLDCGKRYSTSSNLARHRQTHKNNGVTENGEKTSRKCPHCDKVYVSIPAFNMHVRTHNQGCVCPHCGKRFSRPWLLQGHLRTHTGEKPFRCTQCSKTFADKSNLRAHIQTHSSEKPFVCGRCNKAFALKSYLYKHEESSCMRSSKYFVGVV